MSFLGKNINIALVALILVVLLVSAGTAVLYQNRLTARTEAFETTSGNLTQCLTQVDNYRSTLDEKSAQLNDTAEDIRKYDIIYDQCVADKQRLDSDLSTTKQSLQKETLLKENFKSQVDQLNTQVQSLNSQISKLEKDVVSLRSENSDLEDLLNACEAGG